MSLLAAVLVAALGLTAVSPMTAESAAAASSAARGTEYFVSPSGQDTNLGLTVTDAFRTIRRGLEKVKPGDTLSLAGGVYHEQVKVFGLRGTRDKPIVIQSLPGEAAHVDSSLPEFRRILKNPWIRARSLDPRAHEDEYVSRAMVDDDPVNRGAFLDRKRYTRLITYGRLEDLRQRKNETFEKITGPDKRRGPQVTDESGTPKLTEKNGRMVPYRHPWVYMGPGLWWDTETRRVHIRLSHTHNEVPRLADYRGPVDPRRVRLAISPKRRTALDVRGSTYVHFKRLTFSGGGDNTAHLEDVERLTFARVRFLAGSHGVRMARASHTAFRNCQFSGGSPPWYFRSDRKSEYHFRTAGVIEPNNLGAQTVRALLFGSGADVGTTIERSEFTDGHDLYLDGRDVSFTRNWIHNLNDEALLVDATPTHNLRIFENVVTKSLSALSFADDEVGGAHYIYRNLIDLRRPTAGYRPRRPGLTGGKGVWRYGHLYKSNRPDGPWDLFQNTLLVARQRTLASFTHYRDTEGTQPHNSFNNVFVSVNPRVTSDKAITFVPSPAFPAATDGNLYHRVGKAMEPGFRYLEYRFNGVKYRGGAFGHLSDLHSSVLFDQSKTRYPPGYEAGSRESDPRFRRIREDGAFRGTDDLRLSVGSPALGAGVRLPPDLAALDPSSVAGAPDIGAYPAGSGPLRVGVDGRRAFPKD